MQVVHATETAGCRAVTIERGEGRRRGGEGEPGGRATVKARMERRAVRTRARAFEKGEKAFCFENGGAEIRHADDDVDDSSRTDCHANHGTERGRY